MQVNIPPSAPSPELFYLCKFFHCLVAPFPSEKGDEQGHF